MEPCSRLVAEHVGEDREIPGDRRRLGRPRPAAQAEDRRDEPLGRLGARGLLGVLGMVHDGQPEHPGIEQRLAQQRPGSDRCAVVREADDPGVGQLAERGQGLAGPVCAHRPVRQHRDGRPGRGRRGSNALHHARLVRGRRRVGHRADHGEAAMGGSGLAGRHRFGVLVAGLAQVGVEVDEAGGHDDPAVADAGPLVALQPVDRAQDAVLDDDLAGSLPAARRVDEPGPAELEVGHDPTDRARSGDLDRAFSHPRPPGRPRAGRAGPSAPRPRSSPGR